MRSLIIIMFFFNYAICQELNFQQEQYPFPVTFYGVEPQLGFTSAGSYYHHDFGDIDNDGDYDLIVSCGGQTEFLLLNNGTIFQADFQIFTNQIVTPYSDNSFYQAPAFCDINNDGDLDIFLGSGNGSIAFYENISSSDTIMFILNDSTFIELETISPTLDFVDIDADGDDDLFLGIGWTPVTGRIYFYRNEGTPEIPNMVLETEFFEGIDVGDKPAPEFSDIDADGDYDLFIGCEEGTVWYYENIGNSMNYNFEFRTSNYFNIDVGNMSVPRFCDIDSDGDFDLFVANKSDASTNGMEGDISFYENSGSAANADFEFVTGQYLFLDMNAYTSPYIIDIDAENLSELLVCIASGEMVYLENEGTQYEPSFFFLDSAFLNLDFPYQPSISFADLDSDSDYDFVTYRAGFNCHVEMYENIGSPSNPEFEFSCEITSSLEWFSGGIDLCDIDADGDYDLFFGDGLNRIQYWENVGDVNQPRFEFRNENYLNQIHILGGMYPRFGDLDYDQDYDLIMGHGYADSLANYIIYWQNVGTMYNASFIVCDTIVVYPPTTITSPRPALTDIEADGDLDLLVGETGGALLFYRNLDNPYQAKITITIYGNDIMLSWESIPGAEEYYIYYQSVPYFIPVGIPQAIVVPPNTNWTDVNALNQGKRYYQVVVEY